MAYSAHLFSITALVIFGIALINVCSCATATIQKRKTPIEHQNLNSFIALERVKRAPIWPSVFFKHSLDWNGEFGLFGHREDKSKKDKKNDSPKPTAHPTYSPGLIPRQYYPRVITEVGGAGHFYIATPNHQPNNLQPPKRYPCFHCNPIIAPDVPPYHLHPGCRYYQSKK